MADRRPKPNHEDLQALISSVKTGSPFRVSGKLENRVVVHESKRELDGCEVSVFVVETGKLHDPSMPTTYYGIFVRVTESGQEVCCRQSTHKNLSLENAVEIAESLSDDDIFAICEA